ncbi:histidine--tRNA ligase [Candidatus Kuenenbacteria bacterium HGW-Kuenenbacteria-1]|uniref:Histidine--tRNA ligase n=1 Tax=Candidatus Kuenenbacteria bacterium HGW-Kuenenbacteria-1 TaxID=2013812 RepID=A0A2N1UNN9_9BACT|nr:MAG: histidine--tRNA ligase [Candidatus Kuenenbacteria bacterium HGW-Kuenenbacteria-1]
MFKQDILQLAKGVRDFLPKEKIAREKIIDTLKNVFEIFGYSPIETPIFERFSLFSFKHIQGEEADILKESFTFQDNGKRKLILRTELTIPFARFIGMNQNLKMPFKRYQIGQIFRDGPIKLGRYREFWQCDVDVVGIKNEIIDAEIIELALNVFKKLNLDIEIKINNRKILNAILDQIKIPETIQDQIIISIDKLDKIGKKSVIKELEKKGLLIQDINKILELINIDGKNNQEKIDHLKKILINQEGLLEIEKTLSYLDDTSDVIFLPSLARGLAYYTGNVFEIFLKDKSKISGSLAAGGRYDKMIGKFLNSEKEIPAIGISFGLEPIFDALKIFQKINKKTVVEILFVPIGEQNIQPGLKIIKELRAKGYKVDVDYLFRSPSKALQYANDMNIEKVLLFGDVEREKNEVCLKNMQTGKQENVKISNL